MTGMLQLDYKIDGLAMLFASMPEVQAVFLFGSYGTVYQTPLSDIDFAVYYNREQTLQDEAALLNSLTIALDTDQVDLVNLNKAPLVLRFRVINDGRIIFERDPVTTSDFMESVIKYYQDFAITMNKFYRDYDDSLREAYLR
ncbi:MAG: nucleotidyltransferase domain-containing protein [Dethiobacter sp.]|nr:nucleotidyltransferase domain-containing protein [Dethiobacter sp.]